MENNFKRVILIGITGHGKTTLFNCLTRANERVQSGTKSITNMITARLAIRGNFQVLDTPGYGDNEDKLKNFEGIIQPLQYTEIHRIILVIKHDRIVQMIKQIKSMFKYFKNYKEIITIYISYFDLFRGDVIKEKQLIQTRIQNEFIIDSFIFNEVALNDGIILYQLDLILQSSKQFPILFNVDKFIEWFDVFNLKDCLSMEQIKENLNTQFNTQVYKPIMNFIDNFYKQIPDPLYLNYLDELQNFAKQKVEEFLLEFIKQYGEKMNNQFQVNSKNSPYDPYTEYQKSLKLQLSQIILNITNKKQAHPDFIGNQIKACPYCGLLWVKEYNCNKILCGEAAGKFSPSLKLQPLVKFEYKIENNQVNLIENDIYLFKDKDELINKLKDSYSKRQFEQVLKQFNVNYDNGFIRVLQKEFGNYCFDIWIQMIDKRNYDEFAQSLKQQLIYRSQLPKEGRKEKLGCGKYFYWENESLGIIYQTAKSLTKQQILELNGYEMD